MIRVNPWLFTISGDFQGARHSLLLMMRRFSSKAFVRCIFGICSAFLHLIFERRMIVICVPVLKVHIPLNKGCMPRGANVRDEIDYEAVGLIAGLEVHQQLLTQRKLFCNCPARKYREESDGEVLRHMRPTLSELGEYDGTALMEFKTKKNIIYLLNKENVCTYEMDDTPPFLMNQDALDIAVEQCLMLGCDIVDEVHVARKQYLDGSIPTGFQRTAIVGVNGRLPFRDRWISITQVSIEEDSCREVSDQGHLVVWRTDRLGVPLIETVTGPELRTPDEVVEAILLVGRVCRSTGHVRVGLGASRQDVNVSVRGGRRVEIKGVPQAWRAKKLVHGEAIRQVNLLALRDELHNRGLSDKADLRMDHIDVTSMVRDSSFPPFRAETWEKAITKRSMRKGLELGDGPFCVRAVKLAKLAGTLSWPTQPERTFAHELEGRVRVIACLDIPPIITSSEDWPRYEGCEKDRLGIHDALGCEAHDSFVVIWGAEQDTITAAREIVIRYEDALDGVPNETRQPCKDGSTDFERILPGPDRMYPDTDHPPIRMTRERVTALRQHMAPPPWVRENAYSAVGIPQPTIYYLIRRGGADLVDHVVKENGADLRDACFFFGERYKGLKRSGVLIERIDCNTWSELFRLQSRNPAMRDVRDILVGMAANREADSIADLVEEMQLTEDSDGWESLLESVVQSERPDFDDGSTGKRFRYYMGRIMARLRGVVPARRVAELLKPMLEQLEDEDGDTA